MSSDFNASLMSFFLVTPFVARACSRFNHESVGEKCTANSWTRKLSGENAMVAYPGLGTNLAHVEVLAVHRRHQVGIHDLGYSACPREVEEGSECPTWMSQRTACCAPEQRQAMARLVEPTDEVFPAVSDDSRSRSFHAHKCTRSFSETETRNTEREHMLPT